MVKFPSWAYQRFGNPMVFRNHERQPWHVESILYRKIKESLIVSMMPPVKSKIGMNIQIDGDDNGRWYEFCSDKAELEIARILEHEFRDEFHSTMDLLMQQGGLIEQDAIWKFCSHYNIGIDHDEALHKDYYRWRYRDNRRIYLEQALNYLEQ